MNPKYSNYVLLLLLLIFGGSIVLGELISEELDPICNKDYNILFRVNGKWGCASLNDTFVNITVNEIVQLFNNYSLYANQSIYAENWINNNLSLYVPYSGANNNINLGDYNITTLTGVICDSNGCIGDNGGIWVNDSGTAKYIGNVNVTGNISGYQLGLLGNKPSFPIDIRGSQSGLYTIYIDADTTGSTIAPLRFSMDGTTTSTLTKTVSVIEGDARFTQDVTGQATTIGARLKTDTPTGHTSSAVRNLIGFEHTDNGILNIGGNSNYTFTSFHHYPSSRVLMSTGASYIETGVDLDPSSPTFISHTGYSYRAGIEGGDYTNTSSWDDSWAIKFVGGDIYTGGGYWAGKVQGKTRNVTISQCTLQFVGGLFVDNNGTGCTSSPFTSPELPQEESLWSKILGVFE